MQVQMRKRYFWQGKLDTIIVKNNSSKFSSSEQGQKDAINLILLGWLH